MEVITEIMDGIMLVVLSGILSVEIVEVLL